MGRGEGPAPAQRHGALRRTAAAALHRADHRAVARRGPAGRADRLARPPGHPADRGAAVRAQAGLHDHHRDPQHAAGGPGVGHHDLLLPGHHGRDRARPGRSSPRRGTSRPRPTSPGGSDDHHRRAAGPAGFVPTPRATLAPRPPAPEPGSAARPPWTSATSASAYGTRQVLRNLTFSIERKAVTAIIGPSGCGKSTFLRSINRLNDLIPGIRHEGDILVEGTSVFSPSTDLVALRQRVGMVFQRPNPFPKSIFDNVAYGPALNRLVARARSARPGGALPAPGGAVGRGEGPAATSRAPASPAASSSGSASRARWATSPRCC